MTPCVRFKPGVTLGDPPTPTQVRLLGTLESAARAIGCDLVVSCGREGHAATDPHTCGAALDVSVAGLAPDLVASVYLLIRRLLGPVFYVQYETSVRPTTDSLARIAVINPAATASHFHLQAVKGTTYPPQDTPGGPLHGTQTV